MAKIRFATVWLDGCSGCHMSFLDMDERLIEIASKVEVVCSPYVDMKEFPENVDLALIEGAVSSEEDVEKLRKIRKNTKIVVAFGDCAVTGNVSAMRNNYGVEAALKHAYDNLSDHNTGARPCRVVPKQLDRVSALHEQVKIDYFLPGCPPPADAIYNILTSLIEGKEPNVFDHTRFGK
ncbi:MAG: NADP oxidoreductase [Helicobacteraceae bacterium]|jgi:NAD-reducing hydrogenase small subunit|nr:NADP oxidoreductase [Helicobacteraceae bacterium]